MRRAHTVEQVRAAEDELLAVTPGGALMQRAAAGLATAVADYLTRCYGARVLLLVGAGNNGGDALWAGARLARRGARLDAVVLDPDRVHGPGLAAYRAAGGRVVPSPAGPYDVAVDGIVGIGGSGPLRPAAAALVAALGEVPVVAVDTPSGVDVDTGRVEGRHVRADVTVTFGSHKPVHLVDPGAAACGTVTLVDLGLRLPQPALEALQAADVARLLPRPAPDAHKYTRGVVGIRAGSEQYRGAAVLSVTGANSGLVGMVRYVAPERGAASAGEPHGTSVADLVQTAHPEVVLGGGRVQAWVVGSGGGGSAARQLREALEDGVPVVVDADALAGLDGPVGVPAVLTPHAGELARLLEVEREAVEADQLGHARLAAERYDAVVLLKGRHSLAAAPDGRVRVTTVGPPWLSTAGTGDVLGGVTGALLAAGLEPFDAASVGSWLHGAAATLAAEGGPIAAGDVARALPRAVAALVGRN